MIYNLLQNPFIKICGIGIIIYFALFANKHNPDSLGNRLSSENLKKNFHEAKKQTRFIMKNVEAAKEYKKQQENIDYTTKKIACNDVVYLNYSIYQGEQRLHTANNSKFIIGSKTNWDIEQKIMGLKKGDEIKIPLVNSTQDGPSLNYHITIQEVTKNTQHAFTNCQWPKNQTNR